MGGVADTFKASLNPFQTFKSSLDPVRNVSRQVAIFSDPTGAKKKAEQKAESQAQESRARSQREAKSFQDRLQGQRDKTTTAASEEIRSQRRGLRGRRRGLLTGDERGVDEAGQRITTG